MQFIASADDNHMPLKRIKIDWRDGSSVISRDGLYKNHKPYCEPDDSGEKPTVGRCKLPGPDPAKDYSQATCSLTNQSSDDCMAIDSGTIKVGCSPTGGRHFGDSSRACKQQYFEFTNEYNCSSSTASTLVSNLAGVVSVEAQARVLALGYKPDDKVCVFQPRVQVLDNWGWCNGTCKDESGKLRNGCYDGVDIKQCFPSIQNINAWTNYKGWIIVTP